MEMGNAEPQLSPDGPLARTVTEVIRSGEAVVLEQLLREHPGLANARIGDPERGQSRTLLHVVTDWPGNVPEAGGKIRVLVAAGADVNARFTGPHTETPLHWAASSDDIEALDALLDAGADIEAEGAIIAGGTPMADAVAFGQWKAARRLLERGAHANLWQAAALGLFDRVRDELTQTEPTQDELDNALWCAAHGGRRDTAELLISRGADPAWVGHDDLTPAAAAERSEAHELAAWLREQASADGRVSIEFFEVSPEEDEEFLAAWAAEGGGVLYRAIRDEVRCRFVAVTTGGDYALVREDGTAQESGGVVLVHAWEQPPELPTGNRGYIGSRLYRGPAGYVEIAWWSSPLMVFRAQRPGDLYVRATPSRSAS
jgi:uncharacterized protein